MPDLATLIAAHHAAQPAPIALTPVTAARVAARRLVKALIALDPEDRVDVLAQVVVNAPSGPEGRGFALLVRHEPARDPQLA